VKAENPTAQSTHNSTASVAALAEPSIGLSGGGHHDAMTTPVKSFNFHSSTFNGMPLNSSTR
jgi:hypothetical protein